MKDDATPRMVLLGRSGEEMEEDVDTYPEGDEPLHLDMTAQAIGQVGGDGKKGDSPDFPKR